MARKARGGQKRIQFGVQKYKIRIRPVDHDDSDSSKTRKRKEILGIRLDLISQLASKCFSVVCWHCFTFCLVPITTTKGSLKLEDDDNKLIPSTGFRRVCHYVVVIIFALDLSFKFFASINQVMNEPLDNINTIFCLIAACSFFFICGISAATLLRPQETIDLINSWSNVLGHLQDSTGDEYSTFGEPSNALKIIVSALSPFFILTMYTFAVILLPSVRLPFFYYVLYEDNFSSGTIPSIWLRIIFSPLEIVALLLPVMNLVLVGIVLETSISVLRTQIEATRNIPINHLADRRVVERLHMCTEVYNRILNPWYKFIVPQGLLGGGAVVTVALYIYTLYILYTSIRHTELPWFLYVFFPYLAIVLSAIMFLMCWDAIVVLRASEDLVGTLRSAAPAYIVRLAPSERAYSMMRAKAARPNFFHIGNFSDFSLDVTIALAEEILNQLLFLLSL